MKVEAKKIETMRDHDGGTAYSANIYIDGKMVGHIIEDGWGGGLQVNFPKADYLQLEKFLKSQPVVGDGEFHGDVEIFLEEVVLDVLQKKELKKKLKKPMAYKKGGERGNFTEWNCKWGKDYGAQPWASVIASIKKEFPDSIFLNEMTFDEAFKVYKDQTTLRFTGGE